MRKLTYTCKTCRGKFKAWATQGYANCPECRGSPRTARAKIQCPTCKQSREVSLEHKKRLKGKLTECSKCLAITRGKILREQYVADGSPKKVSRIATPCGEICRAKEGHRCNGYRINGGCEHYMGCVDLAIGAGWAGWKLLEEVKPWGQGTV